MDTHGCITTVQLRSKDPEDLQVNKINGIFNTLDLAESWKTLGRANRWL